MPSVERRTALITGAACRIGRAIAVDLARHGWSIGLHYRTAAEAAASLAREIASHGVAVGVFPCDLVDSAAPAGLVRHCTEQLGPVSCLINNASVFEFDAFDTLTPQTWGQHLAVNLTAPVMLTQAFARALPPKTAGNVVNIIDQRVWASTPDFFSYSLSKSALWSATQMMAQALAPRVRVNAIGPGPALRSRHQTTEAFAAEAAATILGRGTSPEEIAAAVRFILDAPSMTGQMIALDGGQHLRWFPEAVPAPPSTIS